MPTHTTLKNITSVNQSTLSDQLETNLIYFFSYGLLNIGAFTNVRIPSSGAYGGLEHKLHVVSRPGYSQGQVWESFRKDWVWESGVECPTQPIGITGVFVDNTFYPISTTGAFAYKIDYPNGRVVFNSAISATANVTCEYSYRYIQIGNGDAPWWKSVQENSMRSDSPQVFLYGSGFMHIPPEQKVQAPALIIQAVPGQTRKGRELGGLSQWVKQEVHFTILTQTSQDLKFIYDVITEQTEKSLIGFDKNLMIQATGFPLTYQGSIGSNAKTYPDLVKPRNQGGFEWTKIKFDSFRSYTDKLSPLFNQATVVGIIEVDVPG